MVDQGYVSCDSNFASTNHILIHCPLKSVWYKPELAWALKTALQDCYASGFVGERRE